VSARQSTAAPNGISFARKVQVVTGAAFGVLGLLALGQAFMLKSIIEPAIVNAVSRVDHDSAARDSALFVRIDANTNTIAQMSRDRIILMAILETTPGPSRQALIASLRELWNEDARRSEK
jgi:hypothetical protein